MSQSESFIDPFGHLEASEHADSIYYADLFLIHGRAWMITGSGKSAAGRLASNRDQAHDKARDCVALIREGDTLYARYDPGALCKEQPLRDDLHSLHKVDVIAYCMSETESRQAYPEPAPLELVDVDNQLLSMMLAGRVYPATFAAHFFDHVTLQRLNDPRRRFERFNELTKGVETTRFLAVPWMPTVEEKADLYRSWQPA